MHLFDNEVVQIYIPLTNFTHWIFVWIKFHGQERG